MYHSLFLLLYSFWGTFIIAFEYPGEIARAVKAAPACDSGDVFARFPKQRGKRFGSLCI